MIDLLQIQNKLWESADSLRANTNLKLNEFGEPVLGLIFLKFAFVRFERVRKELETKRVVNEAGIAKPVGERDFKAKGVIYLPEIARYDHLLGLSLGQDIGQSINAAMEAVEASNPELKDILPKGYGKLDNETLSGLLKNFNSIPDNLEGDAFGMIYEYFLGKFALSEGQ